jgi:hypothetical protein
MYPSTDTCRRREVKILVHSWDKSGHCGTDRPRRRLSELCW